MMSCRQLNSTSKELSDVMEQKTELEASLSQCHRENDQLTSSVSVTLHNGIYHCAHLAQCGRAENDHSGTRQELS